MNEWKTAIKEEFQSMPGALAGAAEAPFRWLVTLAVVYSLVRLALIPFGIRLP